MRLSEQIKSSGEFWLPGQRDKSVFGNLTISNGGSIQLEIQGLFGGEFAYFDDEQEISRIVGVVEKHGEITLEDCVFVQKNFAFGAIATSKLVSEYAYLGHSFEDNLLPEFSSLEFSVDCLEEWLGVSGMNMEWSPEDKTFTLTCSQPTPIILLLADSTELRIDFVSTFPTKKAGMKEAKITQRAFFTYTPPVPMSRDRLTEFAYRVVNLIGFALDTTVGLKDLRLRSSQITDQYGSPKAVRHFYKSVPFSELEPTRTRDSMLFSYSTVSDRLRELVNNWLKAYDRLAPSLSLYFSVQHGGQRHLEGRFLALAQGLETYHRRTSSEQRMPELEFKELVSTILKGCPVDQVSWLDGRLKYANEISLRQRFGRMTAPYRLFFGNSRARATLIGKVVDTRNYLTHYDEAGQAAAAQGLDIWYLSLKMELLFQFVIMTLLGFSIDELKDIVSKSGAMKFKQDAASQNE